MIYYVACVHKEGTPEAIVHIAQYNRPNLKIRYQYNQSTKLKKKNHNIPHN